MRRIVRVVDYIALTVACLAFVGLVLVVAIGALSGVWRELRFMWSHSDDRILLIIVAAAVGWCAFR